MKLLNHFLRTHLVIGQHSKLLMLCEQRFYM